MLDRFLLPPVHAFFDRTGPRLEKSGLGQGRLLLVSIFMGAAGCFAAALLNYNVALVLLLLGRLMAALAAILSRQNVGAPKASWPILADGIVFILFPFFFVLGAPENTLAAALLLCAYALLLLVWGVRSLSLQNASLPSPFGDFAGQGEHLLFVILSCVAPLYFSGYALILSLLLFTAVAVQLRLFLKG